MSKPPIGPGNHDKAWNDPPQLSFNASNSNQASSNRLRMMKKRIPIPMNSVTDPSTAPAYSLPISSKAPLKSIPLCDTPPKLNENSLQPSTESLTEVENKLRHFLKDLDQDTLEITSKEDILKRINIFIEMWNEDKLHQEVKRQMKILANALIEKDLDMAWSIHQSLVVDYTTYCSRWLLGIKALILIARKNKESTASKTEKQMGSQDDSSESTQKLIITPENEHK